MGLLCCVLLVILQILINNSPVNDNYVPNVPHVEYVTIDPWTGKRVHVKDN